MNIQSDTGTSKEVEIGNKIYDMMSELSYFDEHPNQLMKQFIPNDPFKRMNVLALYKGRTKDTVILLHHHDAVDIHEYDDMKPFALSDKVKEALLKRQLPGDVKEDIMSDEWLFGRGSADMKSGAAIQINQLKALIDNDYEGSVLLLSVCDEENLSIGMRHAVKLLNKFKVDYDLEYSVIINSEPTPRIEGKGVIYEGTVSKLMPVCYARGKKSHIGDVYNGFNPILLLSQLHNMVALNPDFSDHYEGEVSPVPTWVNQRDRKVMYDASIPESAAGYFSILSLDKTPSKIMLLMKSLGYKAYDYAVDLYKKSVEHHNQFSHSKIKPLEFKPRVWTFDELHHHLIRIHGKRYLEDTTVYMADMKKRFDRGEIILPDATIEFIEFCVGYLDDLEPLLVIGLSGPYYPSISNHMINKELKFVEFVNKASEPIDRVYLSKNYFMGICDFSYTGMVLSNEDQQVIERNLIGYDTLYHIPFEDMANLNVPVINIGPWGKDLHKITERVHRKDAFLNVPIVMNGFIEEVHKKRIHPKCKVSLK